MRAIRARLPSGLRLRLTAWVAGVMLISAVVVFAFVYTRTGTELRAQIDRDIRGDTTQLAQALRPLRGESAARIAGAARRYMEAQPYSATSTLLFVLLPGQTPETNHREVFDAPAPDDNESRDEQVQEKASALAMRHPQPGITVRHISDVGSMRILERTVPLGPVTATVGAGEPLTIVERAQHSIASTFALAGLAVLLLAIVASYIAGVRVTAPLRRMATVAARVDGGDLAPRMASTGNRRDEVHVLAEAFNHMLDRLSEAFAGQKAFIADASHELRTPLTVIRGQLEVLAAQDDPSGDEVRRVERLVQAEITRISRLVDDLLVLAQSERTDFLRTEKVVLRPFVDDLWDGLSLTAERQFELGPVPDGSLQADPDRLAQALRNLARNAIEHTRDGNGLVRLEVQTVAPDGIRFIVIDDGPGIPDAERERVFERFHRVDAARSRANGGAGLGLAIVRAIAEAHGGRVHAVASSNGSGARVELVLPGFRAVASPLPLADR